MYFHLWPNAYKNKSTALARQQFRSNQFDFFNAPPSSYGYIDSLDFKINNENVKWNYDDEYIDICKIYLNKPLLPGDSIKITTPFIVKIPGEDFSRLGRFKQSYQITQWYPKPAVYDKYGWHAFPYLNEGEFYSEFGSFNVSITLPENYTVAATGVLQNKEELDRLEKLNEETKKIITFNRQDNGFPESSKKWKTLHYTQDSIHDFAWFADKRFHVLKGKIELPLSKREVSTWVFFTNIEGNLWKNALEYVNNAVYYYSKWIGEYPYSQCTAVESVLGAGGGMEYPMITNIGQSGNASALEEVIVHEVGHNWFYGILGSNEREHPWLDEGINSYYEQRYTYELKKKGMYGQVNIFSKYIGERTISPFVVNRLATDYILRNGSDQALDLHSEKYAYENYGIIAYMKGSLAMNYLMNYLGTETFDHCMQEYYKRWQFKHPYTYDLKEVLEKCSGKNLNWFFEGVCIMGYSSDYKIKSIKKIDENHIDLVIRNKRKLDSPLNIGLFQNDSLLQSKWEEGFTGKKKFTYKISNENKVQIDPDKKMFEFKRTNNNARTQGLLKKMEPVKIGLLNLIENPSKTQLAFFPVLGWNTSDGIMPGLLFYNPIFPERRVQYRVMPMFSTGLNELDGIGYSEYNFYPTFLHLQKFNLFAEYNRFHTGEGKYLSAWQKYEGGLRFIFNRNPASPKRQWQSIIKTTYASGLYADSTMNFFIKASAFYKDYSKKFPVSFDFSAEKGPEYIKSWIDCSWGVNYKDRKVGLNIRLFAGAFITNKSNNPVYNFRLSGTEGGWDYTYAETFPDRSGIQNSSNIWPHQFVKNDGGFAISTVLQSPSWMSTINIDAALPVPVPLSIYGSMGTYDSAEGIPWEIGIDLRLIKDIFVIYFPVKMSDNITSLYGFENKTYIEKIRFTLRLSKLVPFKYMNQIPLMF